MTRIMMPPMIHYSQGTSKTLNFSDSMTCSMSGTWPPC